MTVAEIEARIATLKAEAEAKIEKSLADAVERAEATLVERGVADEDIEAVRAWFIATNIDPLRKQIMAEVSRATADPSAMPGLH